MCKSKEPFRMIFLKCGHVLVSKIPVIEKHETACILHLASKVIITATSGIFEYCFTSGASAS